MKNIVVLQITSWVGVSIGAEHVYGSLNGYDKNGHYKKVQLKRKMTKNDAELFSKKDGWHFSSGDETDRFNSELKIIKKAKKTWRTEFPDAIALVEGGWAIASPQRFLDGDLEVMRWWRLYSEAKTEKEEDDITDKYIIWLDAAAVSV